ncbi:DUF881 domain-containing protein [Bacillus benzoevorans]|uniref:Uncharacterized protein YlxW (UPF0749 family) n=1 Tax=Bacillus benzoevorans TaxID=1456 RepID=A0A7X0HQH0_9BACI|nr:DUF881 domain-containing protein [Bacillus benzoevorans]MBB6443750.1 uncharacterized protein YlxW (UPF0749 family) [Bacillus benzoevorans]
MTLITLIIGMMIAVQFQTVQEPIVRDTRDTQQLRDDLLKEKELQLSLIREIQSNEEKLGKYETEMAQSKEKILRDTLNELKSDAGLTETSGPGIVIAIEPLKEELLLGKPVKSISPDLLQLLVNELNQYGAENISIQGQRMINSTVIRDINGETKVDGYALNQFPILINITVETIESAKRLYNQMQVSKSADEFFIDNLRLSVSEPQAKVVVPAYQDTIRIQKLELAESKGG